MTGRLANKVALITGGNSGIGRATALRFVEEGAAVMITGRNQATIDETLKALGTEKAAAMRADATNLQEMGAVLDAVKQRFGALDILFLNAGVSFATPLGKTSEAQFDTLFNTNAKAVFFSIQAALPHFGEKGGSVIINASALRKMGRLPGLSAYCASKAAARAMARAMTLELAPRNIRVNTISPGPIETPILYPDTLTAQQAQGFKDFTVKLTPAGRFADAREVAESAVYLASDESRFVMGADLAVDGGFGQI